MIKIRKARGEDLNEIAKLFVNEYNAGWNQKNALKKIKYLEKNSAIFVLIEKDNVIGVIIIEVRPYSDGNAGYINELIVDSDFQGKGYGKMLMNFAEKYVKKRKGKNIQLVAGRKDKAFKFYKKIGYKDCKDTVYMDKELK